MLKPQTGKTFLCITFCYFQSVNNSYLFQQHWRKSTRAQVHSHASPGQCTITSKNRLWRISELTFVQWSLDLLSSCLSCAHELHYDRPTWDPVKKTQTWDKMNNLTSLSLDAIISAEISSSNVGLCSHLFCFIISSIYYYITKLLLYYKVSFFMQSFVLNDYVVVKWLTAPDPPQIVS